MGGGPLAGRSALVTGGSGGIGAAACVGLAVAGCDVVVHYHERREAAEEVAAAVRAEGRRAVAVRADVTDPAAVDALVDEVASFVEGRGLNVLFNNAGVYGTRPLEQLDLDEWERVLAVSVRGPFLCTRAALPLLRAARPARVINISSNTAFLGLPNVLHYATAKAATIGFTRALACELAADGITVNALVPSLVRTDTADRWFGETAEWTVGQQLIRRRQVPEDLVGPLVFLASDASAFVTGQTIRVDGGRLLR